MIAINHQRLNIEDICSIIVGKGGGVGGDLDDHPEHDHVDPNAEDAGDDAGDADDAADAAALREEVEAMDDYAGEEPDQTPPASEDEEVTKRTRGHNVLPYP